MIIGGIQQIGVGVDNVYQFFDWYKNVFHTDIKVFDDQAEATLMTRYTSGEVRSRHAIYAANLQGGGGLEIWQYTNRTPVSSSFDIGVGDMGLFAARIKSKNVPQFHSKLEKILDTWVSPLLSTPSGNHHFFLKDPDGNIFNVVEGNHWFKDEKHLSGGVVGALIGVSDMETSINYYKNCLAFDQVIYDESGFFKDLSELNGGKRKIRRVLLGHSQPKKAPFGKLFGSVSIELVQLLEDESRKIFEGRDWGDKGFIHLCFDVANMDDIANNYNLQGIEFTVDSGKSFDMGDASGRFSYVEDPDGTLIEMVETFRIPVIKRMGIFFKINQKHREGGVPNWILSSLKYSRVK